jgi:hypothetical protein
MPASHSPRRQTNWKNLFAIQTKKGPRRYHRDGFDTQERSALRRDPVTRNPIEVHTSMRRDYFGEYAVHRVEQLPVRMKLPRLRRLGNKRHA